MLMLSLFAFSILLVQAAAIDTTAVLTTARNAQRSALGPGDGWTDGRDRKVVTVPLVQRRATGDSSLEVIEAELNRFSQKYALLSTTITTSDDDNSDNNDKSKRDAAPSSSSSLSSSSSTTDTGKSVGITAVLEDAAVDIDFMYLATLEVGTPPQSVQVQIDTGSSDLWLASASCIQCSSATTASALFQHDKSSTYSVGGASSSSSSSSRSSSSSASQDFGVTYGSGAVMCQRASDAVTLAGATVANQEFGLCYEQAGVLYPASLGILGLGFSSNARSGGTSFVESAFAQGAIGAPVFALSLGSSSSSRGAWSERSNALTLGGYDSAAFTGSLNWLAGLSSKHFAVSLDAVQVNGRTVMATGGESMIAIIDSGSSLITGPPAAVKQVYAQIPGSVFTAVSGSTGTWAFPCNSQASVSMIFGGVAYSMDVADLISGYVSADKTMCIGSITAGVVAIDESESVGWLVGAAFLKTVYSVYDMSSNRVAFGIKSGTVATPGTFTTVALADVTKTAVGTFKGIAATAAAATVTQQGFTVLTGTALPVVTAPIPHATGIAKFKAQAEQAVPSGLSSSTSSTSSTSTLAVQTTSKLASTSSSSMISASASQSTSTSSTVSSATAIYASSSIPMSSAASQLSSTLLTVTQAAATTSTSLAATTSTTISSVSSQTPVAVPQTSKATHLLPNGFLVMTSIIGLWYVL